MRRRSDEAPDARPGRAVPAPLDEFLPEFDVRHRHATVVHAPAPLAYRTARQFDVQSVRPIRFIFWLRDRLMGTTAEPLGEGAFIDQALGLGWGCLREEPGKLFVAGAACQPWLADVVFTALPPDRFRAFAGPAQVKIAWTLEAIWQGEALTELASETRVLATDAAARDRFRRYWRWARVGILSVRWLLLPAMRRQAEARWRGHDGSSSPP